MGGKCTLLTAKGSDDASLEIYVAFLRMQKQSFDSKLDFDPFQKTEKLLFECADTYEINETDSGCTMVHPTAYKLPPS